MTTSLLRCGGGGGGDGGVGVSFNSKQPVPNLAGEMMFIIPKVSILSEQSLFWYGTLSCTTQPQIHWLSGKYILLPAV